eukprot:TRINITY_DN4389_c0_g1_i2.p1 TRINITY_DN4389_c0_g1~~TRINITY_DN4389_c0_g1_i2.p1  ORF type:complete len:130 (+),score=13.47 TRINITY_DN4389_c0_g1_i2:304-693(+)
MSEIKAEQPIYHVAVIGDECGKSRMVCRFLYDTYEEVDDPTVEDRYTKSNFVVDSEPCKLEILDTSGNDVYASLYKKWYEASEAFICMFSITSTASFDQMMVLIERVQSIKHCDYFPLVIVATQCMKFR